MRISDWSSDVCSSDLGLDNKSASPSCLVQASVSLGDGGEACRPIGMFDDLAAAPVQRGQCLLGVPLDRRQHGLRSEEHTSELQSLMRISYAVFCLKKKNNTLVRVINIKNQSINVYS